MDSPGRSNDKNNVVEEKERPSHRKKKARGSHRKPPPSPEGPFPKGAAEIHPSELEYNPSDESTIIGKGMYGTVYEGRCRGLRVAIKVLNDQKMDAKSLRKFKDEVELMAGLNHTRVVLFLGACMLENGKVACVTEYLPNGNLETVLESKDIQLTMLDKLKYARDIALGCNWLHHSNPVIIHRDLKPSNLLLDDNGRVKVCDFGLSLAQPEHSKGFRSSRIVGTPLYTSPETIKGKTITTKADVYSYGVVLWQILTRQEPFLECEDSDEVYEVVKKGQRPPLTIPPLPAETTPALRQLVADCWQNSPRKRPTFDEILTRLEVMLIEYAIPDVHGAELWKSRFLGKDEVSWPKFVSTFAEDERFGAGTISPHSPPVRCLRNLLATEASPTAVVTLKSFGDFCSWFGPLIPGPHDEPINITKKVVSILQCPWFHASVTNKQARSMLVQQPIGTFLVRYNESVRGGWIISYVVDTGGADGSAIGNGGDTVLESGPGVDKNSHRDSKGKDTDTDNSNGLRRGRIKHVRIYFDKSQPDLGYQLLLPAKPRALQEKGPAADADQRPTTAAVAAAVAGDGIQASSSSSSLSESGGGEEAFKRYVWSSYTTYIVDFINQLLDRNWPGREYLDIKYPCPGSRFASIFAQSSPGEESSDSVLGGSVLVRYLNSMSSMDDITKRDKQKDRIDVDALARDGVKAENGGKERKEQNGEAKQNGAAKAADVERKKAKAAKKDKDEKKKTAKKDREREREKEGERERATDKAPSPRKEEDQTRRKGKKEKKEKENGRERSKSKPEKTVKKGALDESSERVRPKTIHQLLSEREKEKKEKKKAKEGREQKEKEKEGERNKEKGVKRLKRSKKDKEKEGEKEDVSPKKEKKEKGSKKKDKEKEPKGEEKGEKDSKKKEKKEKGSRRLRKLDDSVSQLATTISSRVGASPPKAAKKEKKEKKKERKEREADYA